MVILNVSIYEVITKITNNNKKQQLEVLLRMSFKKRVSAYPKRKETNEQRNLKCLEKIYIPVKVRTII